MINRTLNPGCPPRRPSVHKDLRRPALWITLPSRRFNAIVTAVSPYRDRDFMISPYAGSDGNGERRLDMRLSTAASLALAQLARRYCVTKREIIERLVIAEDGRISTSIDLDSPEWDKYFGIVSRYAVTVPQVLHPADHPIPKTEKTTHDQPHS